jgi:hypothetical protein
MAMAASRIFVLRARERNRANRFTLRVIGRGSTLRGMRIAQHCGILPRGLGHNLSGCVA